MPKTLLIIPAYNEEKSILGLIDEIHQKCSDVDYIVVNDCSTDSTRDILLSSNCHFLDAPVNLGIGGAVQLGYKYASANGYDYAIQVDGDGQHDVTYVDEMIPILQSDKYDCVIGSRFISGEGFQSSSSRRAGIRFLSGLIQLVCGCRVKDVTSGFRAVNKKYIDIFADEYPDDYPEPEVLVSTTLNGARIKEIPVIMRERSAGESSITIKRSIYYMIKVSIAIVMCRISLGLRR